VPQCCLWERRHWPSIRHVTKDSLRLSRRRLNIVCIRFLPTTKTTTIKHANTLQYMKGLCLCLSICLSVCMSGFLCCRQDGSRFWQVSGSSNVATWDFVYDYHLSRAPQWWIGAWLLYCSLAKLFTARSPLHCSTRDCCLCLWTQLPPAASSACSAAKHTHANTHAECWKCWNAIDSFSV